MHFVFGLFFLVSIVATIEWIYLKARKAVRWTSDPNRWDTFAMIEISHRERALRRGLSADETKIIVLTRLRDLLFILLLASRLVMVDGLPCSRC